MPEFLMNIDFASVEGWLIAIGTVVTAATAITILTPTKVDDKALGTVGSIINVLLKVTNVLAGNFWGNKNADADKKPAE